MSDLRSRLQHIASRLDEGELALDYGTDLDAWWKEILALSGLDSLHQRALILRLALPRLHSYFLPVYESPSDEQRKLLAALLQFVVSPGDSTLGTLLPLAEQASNQLLEDLEEDAWCDEIWTTLRVVRETPADLLEAARRLTLEPEALMKGVGETRAWLLGEEDLVARRLQAVDAS